MAQITHNVSTPNDGLGDELRTAMGHQNTMNSELYNTKVDKVTGMGLSQNSFSNAEKSKLAGITDGAEVNVQADFLQNDNTADDYIKNKPSQLFASVGYFHYADLATQTVPLTFVANVNKKLTNDKLGVYTNESQAPYGVSTIWNGTTNQFDFSNLSIGDTLQTRVDLTFNTASANQSYTIFLRMGIGSPSQYDLQITSFNVKNVTSNLHIVRDISFSIDNSDWRDYPSEVYVVTDSTGTVKVNGWYVPIIRKSVNIIDFPDSFKYKGELNLTTPLLVNGIGTIGDVYKVVQTGNYDFGAGLVKYYGGDFIFYDGLSYELFVYNNQLNLGNFPDATLPLVGTEQVLLNDGAWKKVTANNLLSGKLDKVSTVDVEKVYVKNADGTQSMKPTSELGGSSVQSVSGDSVDNTNPLNPIINAIPLSGTSVGNPVTGNIEIKSEDSSIVEIFQNDVTNGFRNSLQFGADEPNFSMASRGVEQSFVDLTLGQLNLYTSRYSILINSKEAIDGGVGLSGMQDYTENITDLDYTQKKYVDNLVNTATNTATVTVELVNSLFTDFYAPDDLRINTINTIFGVGTITLKVNDVAYTLTDLIIKGDKITVETNSESVFNLNIIYE